MPGTSIGSKLNFDLDSSNFPLTHGRPLRLARIERPGNFCREASDTKEDSDHLIDYDDTPSQLSTLRFLAISNSLLSFERERKERKKERKKERRKKGATFLLSSCALRFVETVTFSVYAEYFLRMLQKFKRRKIIFGCCTAATRSIRVALCLLQYCLK